jgi:hypothetical protein
MKIYLLMRKVDSNYQLSFFDFFKKLCYNKYKVKKKRGD